MKVHTGDLTTTPEHLDSLRRVTSTITDIYFCKRTRDGVEEKVPYNSKSVSANQSGLGIAIRDPSSGETPTLHIGGLDKIMDTLKDLDASPESIASAVGREVNAYRDALTLYGIWIPTFAKERRVA